MHINFELKMQVAVQIWQAQNPIIINFCLMALQMTDHKLQNKFMVIILLSNYMYLSTGTGVFTGKSQTETLLYWPSDTKGKLAKRRLEI